MKNKRYIIPKIILLFLISICTILSFYSISLAENKKEETKEGYVQLRAYLTEELQKLSPNIEVIISDGTEDGFVTTTYLYAMNDFSGIVTLPEGLYVIEHAAISGDDNNIFQLNIDERNFKIKKDSPAQMFFSFGDAEIEKHCRTNIENKNLKDEEVEELKKNELAELGIDDIYDENGELNKEKVEEEYKKITGETYEETVEKDNQNGINTEKREVKKETKKNIFTFDWIKKYGTIFFVIIMCGVYLYLKKTGKLKK